MAERAWRVARSPYLPTAVLLAGWALAAFGYWSSWVWAAPVGLRIPGIDFAEYVKFVAEVRSGQLRLTREVFLLPLLALSLSLSLLAHRSELRLWAPLRWIANLLAVPIALSMLPPAWTPPLLTTPEFSKQTIAIAACVLAAAISYPVLRRIPLSICAILVASLALLAIAFPLIGFLRLLPALEVIFGRTAALGGGSGLMVIGFVLVITAPLLLLRSRQRPGSR